MLSEFDQRVLDAICDVVAKQIFPGLVSWSIGYRSLAALHVATVLKASVDDVDSAIARLIESEYLLDEFVTDDEWEDKIEGKIGLRHKAWLECSRFDESDILQHSGEDSLEDWLAWDGIDGSPVGGYGEPFDFGLPIEVVRHPSRDYTIFWRGKQVMRQAYNDMPEVPRTVGAIAKMSRTVGEFACRLAVFLASLPCIDMDEIATAMEALEEGWKNEDTRWGHCLRAYKTADDAGEPRPEAQLVEVVRTLLDD